MTITLDDIIKMSPQKKALALCVLYLLLGALYYFFFLQSSLETKVALETKLADLDQQVRTKERIASRKEKYVQELNALKDAFTLALTKLPDRKEIPGLLYSVAEAGKNVGMDFVLFEPTPKKPEPKSPAPRQPGRKPGAAKAGGAAAEKFYEEIPVRVVVNGSFHDTALFFDKVAKLPRIVNIEEISMGDRQEIKGRGPVVTTSCVIKTYMFMEKKDDQGKNPDEKK